MLRSTRCRSVVKTKTTRHRLTKSILFPPPAFSTFSPSQIHPKWLVSQISEPAHTFKLTATSFVYNAHAAVSLPKNTEDNYFLQLFFCLQVSTCRSASDDDDSVDVCGATRTLPRKLLGDFSKEGWKPFEGEQ